MRHFFAHHESCCGASAGGGRGARRKGSVGFELQKCKGEGRWGNRQLGGPKQCYPVLQLNSVSGVGVRVNALRVMMTLPGLPSLGVNSSQAHCGWCPQPGISAPQALFFSLGVLLSLILRPASVPFVARQVHELAAAF